MQAFFRAAPQAGAVAGDLFAKARTGHGRDHLRLAELYVLWAMGEPSR